MLAGLFCAVFFLYWKNRKVARDLKKLRASSWNWAIHSYRASLPSLNAELERARRYQHKLAVAVISLEHEPEAHRGNHLFGNSHTNGRPSNFIFVVDAILRDNLRHTDIVTYDFANDRYILLFPETTAADGDCAVGRLRTLLFKRVTALVRYGLAEFPNEGLIIDDLVNMAQSRCTEHVASVTLS